MFLLTHRNCPSATSFRKMAALCGIIVWSSSIVFSQFVYYESFTESTAAGWTFQQKNTAPGPRLTAGTAPDGVDPETGIQLDSTGNGWLRLATTTGSQDNAVTLNTDIPSSANDITVEFDFTMWSDGGSGDADGIAVFLYDADVTFDAGAAGGSLSYAQNTTTNGLAGAYVGVGLDVWGNFSNANEGRSGSDPLQTLGGSSANAGFLPNQVVVRGPDDSVAQDGTGNYYYLAGTGGNDYTSAGDDAIAGLNIATQNLNYQNQDFRPDQDADQFRRFRLHLDENDLLTVSIQFGQTSSFTDLFTTDLSGFARPDNLRIGFGAATGGAQQVHEIRNLLVTANGLTNTWYWTDVDDDNFWNNANNWDPLSIPATYGDVVFGDSFGTTDTPDTVTVDGGSKTVGSLFFTGQYGYTLTPDTTEEFTLDTNGSGDSTIAVTNNPNGNADHTIDLTLNLANDLNVNNLVEQALTLGGDIDNGGFDIGFDSFGTTTASGVISGTGDIVVNGFGTTVLSGANTYTGTTTVESGTLQIENAAGLGSTGTATTVEDGGTLALAGNTTVNAETLNIIGLGANNNGALYNAADNNTWTGNINLTGDATIGVADGTTLNLDAGSTLDGAGNAITVDVGNAGQANFDGVITDSAGASDLIKDGAGTLTLSQGGNTYSGDTIVRQGTLELTQSTAFTGTILGSGNNLQLGDGGTQASDDIALLLNSDGGFRYLNTAVDIADVGGTTTLGNGGTSNYSFFLDQVTLNKDIVIETQQGAGLLDGSLIFYNLGGFTGELTGTGGFTKEGDGLAYLLGGQSFTGDVTVNNGSLYVNGGGASAIGDNANVIVADANNNTTTFLANETIGSLSGGGASGGNLAIGATTLTTGGNNSDTTYGGVISGTGNVVKEGTGNMIFTGANTFTGNLEVNAGTVTLGAHNVFADDADLILDGGTFTIDGVTDTLDNFTLQSDSTIDFLSTVGGALTLDAILAPTGNLTVNNWIGDLNGNGDNQLIVTEGAVNANMTTLAGSTTFTGVGNGATWVSIGGGQFELVPDFTGYTEWDGSEDPDDSWGTAANWDSNIVPNSTAAQVLIGSLDPNLDGKTITLPANQQIRDLVINNDDAFTIDGGGNLLGWNESGNNETYLTVLGSSAPTFDTDVFFFDQMRVINNSTETLTFNGTLWLRDESFATAELQFTGSGDTVINGVIFDNFTDKGEVTVDGSGTWTFNANNTFSNGFILNEGTVKIGNDGALGDGTITLNGGTIEATGGARSLDENYTINNSITAGNDDGSDHDLTLSGTGTLSAGAQTITVEDDVTFSLSGDLGGTGALVKAGNGILNLGGNDTNFSGGLTIDAGTVQVGTSGSPINDNVVIGNTTAGDNFLGSGDVTVNAGGTLEINLNGDTDIDIATGGTLTNNGGTITLSNTNANSDFELFGDLALTGGDTTIDVGDNFEIEAGSAITQNGGTLNILAGDNFQTLGTSGTPSSIDLSNGATLNVDLSGGNTGVFTLDQDDSLTLDGATTAMNITGDATTDIDLDGTVNLSNGSTLTVRAGETNLGSTTLLNGGTGSIKGTLEVRGDLNLDLPQLANDPNITLNVSSDSEIASITGTTSIENIGTLTKTGTATTTINSNVNNIQADLINLTGGTLMNGADNQIENNTPLQLAGGTWDTGGFDEVLGTLTLTDTSIIDLNNGDSIIEFADSTGTEGDWDTSDFVYIDNWSGNLSGGGTDQLIFDSAGLSNTQLSRVIFRNPVGLASGNYGAAFIGNELVPIEPVPEPATYVLGALALSLLAGFEYRRRRRPAATVEQA